MKETKITPCRGSNGCLLRESCQRYEPGFFKSNKILFIIERYNVIKGCPDYKSRKLQPIITELRK